MDWDPKFQSWGLPEIHQQQPPPPPPQQQQPQQRQEPNSGRGLDLKLGGSAAPPGPSKRPRAPGSASQNAACLVDGCDADLSGCREYHRRHKVCEAHSKTPTVLVGGREQRFCQQCSRFHLLVEFDEVKRSCRKRLDGHNRRRRKPQPDPLHSASLFPAHQGAGFLSYQHVYSATSDPAWASIIKADEGIANQENRSFQLLERQHHSPPNSTFRIFKEGKQFPFLQDDDAAICNAASSSESCSRKMFADGAAAHVLDTDCALSLLSSPPQTLPINLGPMMPADAIPLRQPLVQQFTGQVKFPGPEDPLAGLSTGFSCPGMNAGQIGNIAVASSSGEPSATHLNCHGFYSGGVADGHSEALPFSW